MHCSLGHVDGRFGAQAMVGVGMGMGMEMESLYVRRGLNENVRNNELGINWDL